MQFCNPKSAAAPLSNLLLLLLLFVFCVFYYPKRGCKDRGCIVQITDCQAHKFVILGCTDNN